VKTSKVNPMVKYVAVLFVVYVSGCQININDPDDHVHNQNYLAEQTVNFSKSAANLTRLRLIGVSGDVQIIGSTDIGTVQITACKQVKSDNQSDAEEHLQLLNVSVQIQTSTLFVKTEQPSTSDGRSYLVYYTIWLPVTMEISVTETNSSILIDSVMNTISINNVNGQVSLNGVNGSTNIGLVNGFITSNQLLPQSGSIDFSVVNGGISLSIPRNTSAEFYAQVVNGRITSNNLDFLNIELGTNDFRGTLGDGSGDISLETVNGNIAVTGYSF